MLHYRLHHDPKSSHQQIVWLLNHLQRDPVLDVGAAQGFLGQLMQGTERIIDAVEPNDYWAERARPYYRHVFASTVEEAHLTPATYEVVICADVLEHTADPVAVLKQLREVATADAAFVISLPNVAHLAVRLLLFAGQFPQMERGILDRTHLHFWTRTTATAMLREAGLQVERVRPTSFPLDELWRNGEGTLAFTLLMRLQHLLLLAVPTLFAWQWVFVARPLAQSCAPDSLT